MNEGSTACNKKGKKTHPKRGKGKAPVDEIPEQNSSSDGESIDF